MGFILTKNPLYSVYTYSSLLLVVPNSVSGKLSSSFENYSLLDQSYLNYKWGIATTKTLHWRTPLKLNIETTFTTWAEWTNRWKTITLTNKIHT